MAGLPSKHVYEELKALHVTELHHANSVATSCLFLREKSLLSRGTVERSGLKQTPQKSDSQDRVYSIWYDVFMDTVDIHNRASRYNEYGPVTFVFDVDLIPKTNTGKIWVTKCNPMYWAGKSEGNRWFQNKHELSEEFIKGDFGQMLVFRHCGGELPFGRFLTRIVLDDPKLRNEDGVDLYSMAYGGLRAAMSESGLNIPIERRDCSLRCKCRKGYKDDENRTYQMFDPFL
ncbi:hypothetical protein HF324_27795 [Chitinophaga oryzae]|uniref:Uncharacterized protein n=1 Tax=Chitinophaga oryzae TaxID=2725414 RepID=A0AAE6ZKI7_9BACT|nr:hypothetical protein [Chitinophaga oryzae]QJB34929.1 hypothetical protein HF329_27935 [Chitinophaga oryzae]QJB41440.1 hypothetical protein HF324_27795 [Chitinophaga oryzae]